MVYPLHSFLFWQSLDLDRSYLLTRNTDWFEQCHLNRSLLQHFELFTIIMSSTLTVFSSLGLSGDNAQGSHFLGSIERLMCFGRWGEGFFLGQH